MEYHRLIEKTDRKVEVLFSRFLCVTFTTTLQGSSPKQLHVVGVEQTLSPTSSVLSVILINLCPYLCSKTLPHPGPSIFPGGGISLSPPSLKPPLHPPPRSSLLVIPEVSLFMANSELWAWFRKSVNLAEYIQITACRNCTLLAVQTEAHCQSIMFVYAINNIL